VIEEKKIKFFYPNKTLTISLTGEFCDRHCLHCDGVYLKGMTPKEVAVKKLEEGDYLSVLVSGGFNEEGKIPITQNINLLKRIKKLKKRVVIHPGFLSLNEIKKVKPFVDAASFDFIYDDDLIKRVYHLPYTGKDFRKEYLLLRRNFKTYPHIIVGLDEGKIKGEFEIIDVLAEIKPSLIVFLVIIPTRGTAFQDIKPPEVDEVYKVFESARRKLRLTKLYLGCMRPKGKYRDELDVMAYEVGFTGFVNPSQPLKKMVKDPEVYYECGILYP